MSDRFSDIQTSSATNPGGFLSDRRGNFAILTAMTLPVMMLSIFGGVSVTMALAKRQELANVAQLACSRAVKPTRMKILRDEDRTARATTYFDNLAEDRDLTITDRAITTGWLTAEVRASASIPMLENMAIEKPAINVSVAVTCEGLPPYPAKGDSILTSNFQTPSGENLVPGNASWGVYKPTEFGWEGGTGPGIEVQDWSKANFGVALPPEFSQSPYVVELDSHGGPNNTGNSSMHRTLELHKGTYRFSFWYFGRQEDPETNTVTVSLAGVRPESGEIEKLRISRPRRDGWRYESFPIEVSTYSLYKLTIAAKGKDDTTGGNFNNLKLEYIKRPGEQ